MSILKPPQDYYSKLELLINGEWVASRSESYTPVYDPGKGEVIAEMPNVVKEEIDQAVEAAWNAFEKWSKLPIVERAQYLFKIKNILEEYKEDIARVNTQNHGKVIGDSRGDLRRTIENVEAAIAIAYTLAKGEYQQEIARDIDEILIREPLGPFAIITPYNFPVMIPFWFIPYALVLGDTLVVKPSEVTPLPLTFTFKLLAKVLPPGVVNIVYTAEPSMVQYLVSHPQIEGTAFVGTSRVALILYEISARHGKRYLGGGSASNYAIVMPDADLEKTVPALISAKYGNTGQRCLAIQNIVVVGDDDFYEKFKRAFYTSARRIKVGYGLDETSEMGPMASERYKYNVIRYIEMGLEEGAKILLDGREYVVPEYPKGYYLGPTILEDVSPDMKVAREEIFGPVANLMRARNLDEAIEWVNKNKYHHSAVIFTKSGAWARRFVNNVSVGNVGVNIGIAAPVGWFPFGGRKLSGLGSHHPQIDVVDFFTDRKVVIVRWWA